MRNCTRSCHVAIILGAALGVFACSDSGGTSAGHDGAVNAGGSNGKGGVSSGASTETQNRSLGGASTHTRSSSSGGEIAEDANQNSVGGAATTRSGAVGGLGNQTGTHETKPGNSTGGAGLGSRADASGSGGRGGSGRQSTTSVSPGGGSKSSDTNRLGTGGRSKAVETAVTGGTSNSETTPSDSSSPSSSSSKGCSAAEPLKSGRASIDVSGTKREYILKVPDGYVASKPYKLIFAFHWKGGSANDVVTGNTGGGPYYGLEKRANGSAIFVAPEGIDAGFANTNGRDIALVRALLELFESKLCIDSTRIFSTGFSYGGMMSDAIGCELADVFRAIAPMSGGIPNAQHPYSGCNQVNDHPIAVWMAHGDNDSVVPLAAGKAALEIFVTRNQCKSQTSPVTPSPCVAYQGCATGYPVHWCQFSGGHGAPDFASAAIWDFFNQF